MTDHPTTTDRELAYTAGQAVGQSQVHPLKVFIEAGNFIVHGESAVAELATGDADCLAAFMDGYRKGYLGDEASD